MENLQNIIKRDNQIKKFCMYGFLKNLKFFEPYLLIFLMSKSISLFEIGILISIREIIISIFEIPSGIIADYFGRKKELYFCFSFYMISFVFFFLTNSFLFAAIAMSFYALGEAFRSGTHKAMIYTYLDKKNWQNEKTFVYGRTRSFSLIGSSISSILSIIIIIISPEPEYIFAFSIIPYFLDFILIISYPKYLDNSDTKNTLSIFQMIKSITTSLKNDIFLKNFLLEEGIFESTMSFVKDLVQPMMKILIVGSGIILIQNMSAEENLNITLGLIYAIINIIGSVMSKKAYIIKNRFTNTKALYLIHLSLGISLAFLGVLSKNYLIICIVYLVIYSIHSMRKPIFVDEIDNHIDKSTRASILSISAQLKSIMLMIFAPLFGYIADTYSISIALILISILLIFTLPLLKTNSSKKSAAYK